MGDILTAELWLGWHNEENVTANEASNYWECLN